MKKIKSKPNHQKDDDFFDGDEEPFDENEKELGENDTEEVTLLLNLINLYSVFTLLTILRLEASLNNWDLTACLMTLLVIPRV